MIRYLSVIFLSAVLFGCAATPYIDLSGITAEDVTSRISSQSDGFKYFSSSGYGNFETKNGAYSAGFKLAISRPSFTSVYLYGPFGMKVGQVRLTPDTLLVYNSLQNEVFIGRPTISNLREFLMIGADGASITDILLDLMPPISHLTDPQMRTRLDGTDIGFLYSSGDTTERYTVDGKYMRTTEYEKSVGGKPVLQIKYADFTTVNSISVPRSVWFEDLSHGISARLYYQDIAVNEKEVLEVTVPADAKEIILN